MLVFNKNDNVRVKENVVFGTTFSSSLRWPLDKPLSALLFSFSFSVPVSVGPRLSAQERRPRPLAKRRAALETRLPISISIHHAHIQSKEVISVRGRGRSARRASSARSSAQLDQPDDVSTCGAHSYSVPG